MHSSVPTHHVQVSMAATGQPQRMQHRSRSAVDLHDNGTRLARAMRPRRCRLSATSSPSLWRIMLTIGRPCRRPSQHLSHTRLPGTDCTPRGAFERLTHLSLCPYFPISNQGFRGKVTPPVRVCGCSPYFFHLPPIEGSFPFRGKPEVGKNQIIL